MKTLKRLAILVGATATAFGQDAPGQEPDLTLSAAGAMPLAAEGDPQLHTFVIPVGGEEARYVEKLQLRPGSIGYVRHAVIRMDSSLESQRRDSKTQEAGFPGRPLYNSVRQPHGLFAVWTPKAQVSVAPEGASWRIHPHSDLVVTLHLFPDGMEHSIQPKLDLWFADEPGRQQLLSARLANETLDLAPDQKRAMSDTLAIPAPVWVSGYYVNANRLGDGYRVEYATPVATPPSEEDEEDEKQRIYGMGARLGRGTEWKPASAKHQFTALAGRVRVPAMTRFDIQIDFANTEENAGRAPIQTEWGSRASDEIAEVYLQLIAHNEPTAIIVGRAIAIHQLGLAIEAAEKRLQDDPENSKAHAELAYLYADIGGGETAVSHGRKAVSLRPEDSNAHAALAAAYLASGFQFSAQEHAEKAIDLDQSNANAWFNLGNVFLHYEIPVRARNCYQNAADLEPRDTRFLNNLATMLIDAKEHEEARQLLEKTLLIDPLHARANANMARIYEATFEPQKAIESYKRALDLAPELAATFGPRLEKLTGKR
ncbi:MAG: tetratricopeptide repeat protein [Verrucomicrobiota bacterium]